jgi:hypothetical protein
MHLSVYIRFIHYFELIGIFITFLVIVGGIALWELVDNFHTFVHLSGAVEHDDLVTSVGVVSGGKKAVSAGADRWLATTFSMSQ